MTLQDETGVKLQDDTNRRAQLQRVRKAVLEGDYDTVRKLSTRHLLRRNHRPFIYEVYRQEYLELIERQEYQRAFIYLTKRLKPFESLSRAQGSEDEYEPGTKATATHWSFSRTGQRWQKYGRQNSYNGNHNQQLN